MNSREENTNLVLKGIKKVDKCIDTLMKDIDCVHTRYLLVNRILSASISSNIHYYTQVEVKNIIDKKVDILENLFSEYKFEEEE